MQNAKCRLRNEKRNAVEFFFEQLIQQKMPLQNINDSFINFIEQKQIDVPEDFIEIFSYSITMDQLIDSETAKNYLQHERQEQLGRSQRTIFKENEEFKEISREEFEKLQRFENGTKNGKNSKRQHGGQNKKFYLLSPDSFKTLLLLRKNDNGDRFRRYMITLEKIFKEFMIQLFGSKERLIEQLQQNIEIKNKKLIKTQQQLTEKQVQYQQELQEKDDQLLQQQLEIEELEDRIDQQIYKYNVIKKYIVNENNQQEEIDYPQIICYTSNTNVTMKRYSKLLNKYYDKTFIYGYEVLNQNLDKRDAIQQRDIFIEQYTGEQRIQHRSIQNIIPLFE